jgi:hypothetical protein
VTEWRLVFLKRILRSEDIFALPSSRNREVSLMRFPIAPKRRPHRTGLSLGRWSICLLNQKQSSSANVRFSLTITFLLRDIKQTQTYHRGST